MTFSKQFLKLYTIFGRKANFSAFCKIYPIVKQQINILTEQHKKALQCVGSICVLSDLEEWQQQYLGKKSVLAELSKSLKTLSNEEKREIGQKVQVVRQELTKIYEERKESLQNEALAKKLEQEWIDITLSKYPKTGAIHPLAQVQRKVEDVFTSLGFEIADGPEVETEWHNFDALNIPETHPARDMQDTFWISNTENDSKKNSVLRTHTSSSGQIRAVCEKGAPLRVISPGRVFRNEATDMTHDAQFYQVEGILIDKDITLAHLKGTIQILLDALFQRDIKIRFRPGYFPFVEPGLEVDIWYEFTDKNGKKRSMWMEFMGCGMTHPNVLKNCNVDPEEYSGFAFGFGLSRLVMLLYGLDDLRYLSSQKQAFLRQF